MRRIKAKARPGINPTRRNGLRRAYLTLAPAGGRRAARPTAYRASPAGPGYGRPARPCGGCRAAPLKPGGAVYGPPIANRPRSAFESAARLVKPNRPENARKV